MPSLMYEPIDYKRKASNAIRGAGATFGKMQPKKKTESTGPGKSAGGYLTAGTSGAATGALGAMAMGAKAGSTYSYVGAAVGAVVGLLSYAFSN